MNILYCFDENYNKQGLVSIQSLIDNNNCQLNINIIHNNFLTLQTEIKKLSNLKNVEINFFNFEESYKDLFPKKSLLHVSEATYYRIFIEAYLDTKMDKILYIDPDVVCINNIQEDYKRVFNEQKKLNYIISARTSGYKNSENSSFFETLNIKQKYFNAGVMFIDLIRWREENLTQELIAKMNKIKEVITFWDQDVLNAYFDGKYLELDKSLNFHISKNNVWEKYKIDKNIKLLHYSGSKKPWYVDGGIYEIANYYHSLHYKLFKNYHIIIPHKKKALITMVKSILNFDILKLEHPLKYLFQVIELILYGDKKKFNA